MDVCSPPPVQKGATHSAVCGFLVKETGFDCCAHRIEEGNELVSDPKETECLSPVHDRLAKGQAVLGKESKHFQSQDLSSLCRIG